MFPGKQFRYVKKCPFDYQNYFWHEVSVTRKYWTLVALASIMSWMEMDSLLNIIIIPCIEKIFNYTDKELLSLYHPGTEKEKHFCKAVANVHHHYAWAVECVSSCYSRKEQLMALIWVFDDFKASFSYSWGFFVCHSLHWPKRSKHIYHVNILLRKQSCSPFELLVLVLL